MKCAGLADMFSFRCGQMATLDSYFEPQPRRWRKSAMPSAAVSTGTVMEGSGTAGAFGTKLTSSKRKACKLGPEKAILKSVEFVLAVKFPNISSVYAKPLETAVKKTMVAIPGSKKGRGPPVKPAVTASQKSKLYEAPGTVVMLWVTLSCKPVRPILAAQFPEWAG
jgi:hypothetical protein